MELCANRGRKTENIVFTGIGDSPDLHQGKYISKWHKEQNNDSLYFNRLFIDLPNLKGKGLKFKKIELNQQQFSKLNIEPT